MSENRLEAPMEHARSMYSFLLQFLCNFEISSAFIIVTNTKSL